MAEITEHAQHTLSEILSQPQCWDSCLAKLAASAELQAAVRLARPGAEWIFVGCGTSYYLALAAASTFNYLNLPARAVPASDLLLYPALTLHRGRSYIPVVISRSGRTSETVQRRADARERISICAPSPSPVRIGTTPRIRIQRDVETSRRRRTEHRDDPILYLDAAWALQYLAAIVSGNSCITAIP
jgi:DNA-binding MurR/RpiR family transcriptional regulator